ncbi:MAG: helix-turn-helix transcriptional regulator [Bellilinea sp.]
MSPRSQAPLTTEYILLGFAAQGPVHGYDLHKQISTLDGISSIWHVKQSQLYALLEKLESMGYLQAEAAPGAISAPRKEYHLTAAGREAFEAWVVSPVPHARQMRQEFLARLYFARLAGPVTALKLIEAQYAAASGWQQELQTRLTSASSLETFQRTVDQYRLSQIDAILKWLDQCKTTAAR